jgi:tripartite-type tricarboxylate transporter receptor subunit TctC
MSVNTRAVVARVLLALLPSLAGSGAAGAEEWPTRAIHVIVPFTAGSATDVVARVLTEQLSSQLGQPLIVDNRPGAGGTIGAASVARADPDGYTLLVQSASHTVTPTTYLHLSYDTVRDLRPVLPLAVQPNVLIVSPSLGITSVKELIARAKAHPGTMTYASAGTGSATHLNAERFRIAAGFEGVHVPFKGTPEAMTEVLAGRVDFYFCPVVAALPQIRDGKLVALAVGSSTRSSVLPDVPTTVEAGVPDSDYTFWVGMFVPAKTPQEIVSRLYRESRRALGSPTVRARYASMGADPLNLTAEQFDSYIRKEVVSNALLIKAAKITPQ